MLRSTAAMSQNYKDTLNLPRTDFPMKAILAAREPELSVFTGLRPFFAIK
jgi:hypothetical protein